MKRRIVTLATLTTILLWAVSVSAQQQVDVEALRKSLQTLSEQINQILATLPSAPEPTPTERVVHVGEDLQAALNAQPQLPIKLDAGGTYVGTFTLPSGTILNMNGAKLEGQATNIPVLTVAPGTHDVTVRDGVATSQYTIAVLIGRNDSQQTTLDRVPQNIRFERFTIPSHRGKRAIEINARDTELIDCVVDDAYSTSGQDTQAVAILNSAGNIAIRGGKYVGGSNGILVGGDYVKVPGMVPTGITIENAEVSRPLSWMTDGIVRKVKNLIEFKTGRDVVVRNNRLRGNWKDAQVGFAVVLTPASGGLLDNVLFENNDIRDTASGFQVTGKNDDSITPQATQGLVIRGNTVVVDIARFAAGNSVTGRFMLIQQEAKDVAILGNTFGGNIGSALIVGDFGRVMDPDGTQRSAGPMQSFVMRDNYFTVGKYGLFLAGGANGSNWRAFTVTIDVGGNTLGGAASALRTNFPSNRYLARADFDALFVDAANGDYRLNPTQLRK